MLVLALAGCSSGDDANKLAGDLEDRLTDALDFDGGSTQDGAPPEEGGGSDAPGITSLDTPGELGLGQLFVVRIASEFGQPEAVDSAIVYVEGAGKYIRVTSGLVAVTGGFEMRLAGVLLADEALRNKSFRLKVALHTSAGVTGAYQPWNLQVLDLAPMSSSDAALGDAGVSGGTFNDTGRPAGDGSSDAPQILGIDAPDSVTPQQQVDIVLYSDNLQAAEDVQAIIVSVPTSDSYWRVTDFETIAPGAKALGEAYGFRMSVTVPTLPQDVPGMVLLWALEKTNRRVGLYFPWEFTFSHATDGDEDAAETDTEADVREETEDVNVDGDTTDPEPETDGDQEEAVEETEQETEAETEVSIPDPSHWGFQTVFYNTNPESYMYLGDIGGAAGVPLSPCVTGNQGDGPVALCQNARGWETLPRLSDQELPSFSGVVISADATVFLANASFGDIHTYDPELLWTSYLQDAYPYADYDVLDAVRGPSGNYYITASRYETGAGMSYYLYRLSPDLLTAVEIPFTVQNPGFQSYMVQSMCAVADETGTADIVYLLTDNALLKWDGTALTEAWTSETLTLGYESTIHGTAFDDLWMAATYAADGHVFLLHYDGTQWNETDSGIAAGEMGPGAVWSLGGRGLFFVVDNRVYYLNPDYGDAPLEIGVDPMGYGSVTSLWGDSLDEMYLLKSDRVTKLTFDWPAPECDPNTDMAYCEGAAIVECDPDTWSWISTDCGPGYTCLNDSAYPTCVPEAADGDLDTDEEGIPVNCTGSPAYCDGSVLYECIEGTWTPSDCMNQDLICVTGTDGALCGQCDPAVFVSFCSNNSVMYCSDGFQAADNCSDRDLSCVSDGSGAWCSDGGVIPQSDTYAFTAVFGTAPGENVVAYSAANGASANPCVVSKTDQGYFTFCDGGGDDFSLTGTVPADLQPRDIAYSGVTSLLGGGGIALGDQLQNDLFLLSDTDWSPATCSNYPSDDMTVNMIAGTGSDTAFFVATNDRTEKQQLLYRTNDAVGYVFTLPDTVTVIYDLDAWWPVNDPVAYLITNDGIYRQSLSGQIAQVVAPGQVGFEPGCSIAIDRTAGQVWATGYDRDAGHPMLLMYDGEGWTDYPVTSLQAATGQMGDLWPVDIDTVLFIFGDQVLYHKLGGGVEAVSWEMLDVAEQPLEIEGIDVSVVYLRTDRSVQKLGPAPQCQDYETYCDGTYLYQCMGGVYYETNCSDMGEGYSCTTCEGSHQCALPCTQTDVSFCDGDVLNTCYWCGDGGYWDIYDCNSNNYVCVDGSSPYCAAP